MPEPSPRRRPAERRRGPALSSDAAERPAGSARPIAAAARRRALAALAARRHRQRVGRNAILVSVEIDAATLDKLIGWNWLDARDAGDRRKIGRAISMHLAAAPGGMVSNLELPDVEMTTAVGGSRISRNCRYVILSVTAGVSHAN
jgi:hypothetical protein